MSVVLRPSMRSPCVEDALAHQLASAGRAGCSSRLRRRACAARSRRALDRRERVERRRARCGTRSTNGVDAPPSRSRRSPRSARPSLITRSARGELRLGALAHLALRAPCGPAAAASTQLRLAGAAAQLLLRVERAAASSRVRDAQGVEQLALRDASCASPRPSPAPARLPATTSRGRSSSICARASGFTISWPSMRATRTAAIGPRNGMLRERQRRRGADEGRDVRASSGRPPRAPCAVICVSSR